MAHYQAQRSPLWSLAIVFYKHAASTVLKSCWLAWKHSDAYKSRMPSPLGLAQTCPMMAILPTARWLGSNLRQSVRVFVVHKVHCLGSRDLNKSTNRALGQVPLESIPSLSRVSCHAAFCSGALIWTDSATVRKCKARHLI